MINYGLHFYTPKGKGKRVAASAEGDAQLNVHRFHPPIHTMHWPNPPQNTAAELKSITAKKPKQHQLMDFRTLELTVISAKNLPKAHHLTKMNPYVVAFLDGPSSFACVEERTPVDQEGDRNATWNHTMMFTVDESEARKDRLILVFKICSTGSFRRDKNKLLGEVRVPIKDILSDDNDHGDDGRDVVFRQARMISYPVIGENSGDSGGVLNLSYRFGVRTFSARLISNVRRPFRQPGMSRP